MIELLSHCNLFLEHILEFPDFGLISHGLPPLILDLISEELDLVIILLLTLLILLDDSDLFGQ
jgi:hypothetical protein